MSQEKKKEEKELEEKRDERIEEYGQLTLEENQKKRKIHLLSIIGEVEGHENAPGSSKTTKYDHVLPQLAQLEDDDEVKGMLVLLNTSGGDVDAGLAIAEMIQDRIISFVSGHASIGYDHVKELMLNTKMLTRDLGTVLVGREAVEQGLIDEVGGIKEALTKLHRIIDERESHVERKN